MRYIMGEWSDLVQSTWNVSCTYFDLMKFGQS